MSFFAIPIELHSNEITSFFSQNYAFHWLMRDNMEQFSRLLFVRSSTLEEVCTIVVTRMAQCVTAYHARNHGITGCRSWLMSLQGVPDRIISLDGAPQELFSPPPWANESSATQPDEQSASGCLLNTIVLLKSTIAEGKYEITILCKIIHYVFRNVIKTHLLFNFRVTSNSDVN